MYLCNQILTILYASFLLQNGKTPLIAASWFEHLSVVKELVKVADVNISDEVDTVKLLNIDNGTG